MCVARCRDIAESSALVGVLRAARHKPYQIPTPKSDSNVQYSPTGKLDHVTPDMAASGVEDAFRMLEGRWKMVILFQLFAHPLLRFSEIERAIPAGSQKMVIQQLREIERDGI